jgi:protein-L-isoaspartate(D-aspartate) O-methyltransferase
MMDFRQARKEMAVRHLRGRDIVDERVLRAMGFVPREEFLPKAYRERAYDDGPLPIGRGQTISQPYIVALMTQLLGLQGGEKVLEVGTGSGYQAAVLASLARQVLTIERHGALLEKAERVFRKLGLKNIKTRLGDGSLGWREEAPYEAIVVTAGAREIPQPLIDQLADGGRLVIPLGSRTLRGWQELIRLSKKGKKIKRESFGGCAFVPLVTE